MCLSSGAAIIQLAAQPLFLPEIFGTRKAWIIIPFINMVLCTIHLVIGSFFPLSPKHLYLNKHQEMRARNAILFYQGEDSDPGGDTCE
jgi:hypothetical protein